MHDTENGRILDVNQTAVELTGYSKEELVGESVARISADSDIFNHSGALDRIKTAVAEGALTFEWISRRRNGETFWTEVTLKSSRIGGENRVLAVVRDINDRKKAEKTLAESEQKFRAIFDHAPYGIAINSLDGKYLDVNRACTESFGLSKEELLSLTASEVASADENTVIVDALKRDGAVKNLETTVQSHSGALIHVLFSSVLIEIQGEAQILSMTVNITDKKRAEAALRKSEATLRSLFSAAPVGLVTLDNRVFRSVNERFCEIVGYPDAALVGCSSLQLYETDVEYQRVGQHLYDALWKDGFGYAETRFRRSDGSWRDVSLHAAPLQPDDRSAGVAVAIQDITERKRTEEELQQHREHLEELVAERTAALERANADLRQAMSQLVQSEKLAALGNLVAGIAHELNTP
ncbi:MAG: PAS domain S-box protein, partial [Synechococcaceae cyanobacterium SM1_2_3]|nr:PAS domain S-box protein [Synechococcaceae cyanobacterium SM1_2_3]